MHMMLMMIMEMTMLQSGRDTNLEGYFELSFIMTNVCDLDANLGVILNYLSTDAR
jgi:hypothetical protein